MAKQRLDAVGVAAGKPQIGAPVMTVGDIAAAIAPIAPNSRERIMHWSKTGVLEAIGREHAGPGNHRLYSADVRYDAALLHVMTSVGLPAHNSQFLPEAMTFARAQLARWKKSRDKSLAPLTISVTAKGGVSVGSTAGADAVMTISVDLAKVWARVST